MIRSLRWRLLIAFFLLALTTAGLVAVVIRFTNSDQLSQLIIEQQRSELNDRLVTYYTENGSWQGIENFWFDFRPDSGLTQPLPKDVQRGWDGRPNERYDRRQLFGLLDENNRVIIPIYPDYPANSQVTQAAAQRGDAINVDGVRVGTILTAPYQPLFNPQEELFLQRTDRAIALAAVGAVLVALVLGLLLARSLTRPLTALTAAAEKIAGGDLEQQVTVKSTDEIGRLAASFNRMSREVSRSNQLRRQMTADIAHDLRTPLTVIAGYIESMRDGVLKPTPERMTLIYGEIEHLQRLVGDLRLLAQAEAGELPLNPQALNPRGILERAAAPYTDRAAQQQVSLHIDAKTDLPALRGDEDRLYQVFSNLISNALRYTPAGGTITLTAALNGAAIEFRVQDTGSGIPPEHLDNVFNRFYRADSARSADEGEMGLGLAICKALIDAHGGSIRAQSAPGEGSTFILCLPLAN
ncbi:MAG: HAMP domain-containing protein [Anaerolineae bacterium]|nr:HAMP domain-containing protein [Anaerolineae bacterium]